MGEIIDPIRKEYDQAIKLPVFEGPLDLLLYLIRRNEIDIYDIPISTVTHQYLDILAAMEKKQLEVAGEFFVMAATLMQIKSRMLLPVEKRGKEEDENEDEEIDPRWELVQQLMEYKKFKDASGDLEELIRRAQDLLPREVLQQNQDKKPQPLRNSDKIEIWNTFNAVLRRLAEKIVIGQIEDEAVTVADRMDFILVYKQTNRRFSLSSLLENENLTLQMLVSTFLAILELTRLNEIRIEQDEIFGEIHCEAVSPPAVELENE